MKSTRDLWVMKILSHIAPGYYDAETDSGFSAKYSFSSSEKHQPLLGILDGTEVWFDMFSAKILEENQFQLIF